MAAERTEKLDCAAVRPLLSAFADGETTPTEMAQVRNHLASCGSCASELAFVRTVNAALFAAPMEAPAPELFERIAAATYARPTLRQRIAQWLQPVPNRLALGTALAAGLTLALVLPRWGGNTAAVVSRQSAVGGSKSSPVAVATPAPETVKKTQGTIPAPPSVAVAPSVPDNKTEATSSSKAASPKADVRSIAAAPNIIRLSPNSPSVRVAEKDKPKATEGVTPRPPTQVASLNPKTIKSAAPTLPPTVVASHHTVKKAPAPMVVQSNAPKPEAPTRQIPVEPAPTPTNTEEKPDPRVAVKEPEPTPVRQVAMAEPTRTAPSFSLKLGNAGAGRKDLSLPSPPNVGSADAAPNYETGRRAIAQLVGDNPKVASLK